MEDDSKRISLEGRTYAWTGKTWVDVETFTNPPAETTDKLNAILLSRLNEEDGRINDFQLLLTKAMDAKAHAQHSRAEGLARRALRLAPGNLWAAAIYCSCLRASGKPEEALKELGSYLKEDFPPLLVTHAAALCDMARWEEAKVEITRAISMQKNYKFVKFSEAWRVINRIKAARSDLFKRKKKVL